MSSKVIFTTPRTEKQDGSYFVCIKPSVVLYETHMKDTKDIKRCIDDIEISDSWMMQMSIRIKHSKESRAVHTKHRSRMTWRSQISGPQVKFKISSWVSRIFVFVFQFTALYRFFKCFTKLLEKIMQKPPQNNNYIE